MKTNAEEISELISWQRASTAKERAAIARELHDNISQNMTALTLELALLQGRLGKDHPHASKMGEVINLATNINKAVRRITNDIHPRSVEEFGLVAALKSFCQNSGRERQVPIRFTSDVEKLEVSDDIAIELYRLVKLIVEKFTRSAQVELAITLRSGEGSCFAVLIEVRNDEKEARALFAGADVQRKVAILGAISRVKTEKGISAFSIELVGSNVH